MPESEMICWKGRLDDRIQLRRPKVRCGVVAIEYSYSSGAGSYVPGADSLRIRVPEDGSSETAGTKHALVPVSTHLRTSKQVLKNVGVTVDFDGSWVLLICYREEKEEKVG